jgi:trans-2,3-dihydro-3-hydroxyanthranilate isomerase
MEPCTRRQFGQLLTAGVAPLLIQRGSEPQFSYVHLDVFTTRRFEGNQLLVFLRPAGLSEAAMHTLTRESNLSECTFVFPPEVPGTDHRVRIFTRNGETPFAGHPTIGTAFALAHAGTIRSGTARTVFGLGVGPTPVDLEWEAGRLRFAWMTQLNPTFGKTITDRAGLAVALGLEASALDGQPAPPQEVNCGSNFFVVPIATRKGVDGAVLDRAKADAVFAAAGIPRRGIYIFSTERGQDDAVAYSRLLPAGGGLEDPATGSAAGPAACFIAKYGFVRPPSAGAISFLQGVLVRRPSRILVDVTIADGNITRVKVGGPAVVVGEGSVGAPAA